MGDSENTSWMHVSFVFLFVQLHSIEECLCFDSIRFDKIDVLGVQREQTGTIHS